jgi:polar amino acid transport system substrate-binding protein
MKSIFVGVWCAALLCAPAAQATGTEPVDENLPPPIPAPAVPKQKLIVGVAPGPPFNIHEPDGSWSGISVELWKGIASALGIQFEFRETDLNGSFTGLASGWLDVAVGPLTITQYREQICDFTHAYFTSSLGAAVVLQQNHLPSDLRFISALLNGRFWLAILRISVGLLAIMAIVAFLIWLCERKANAPSFGGGGRPVRGFGMALWWSAVTMTTVGYGDIAPRTVKGRVLAVLWMFVSLVLVSTFTATMASILTAARISEGTTIRGLDDLRNLRVGTFPKSTAAQYLAKNHISFVTYDRAALFEALARGKIQAVIYDEPFLRYVVRNEYPTKFTVLPLHLDSQLYAFALRQGSPLRKAINQELLREVHEPDWSDVLYRFMGYAPD